MLAVHQPVAGDLGHDRGRGDRGALGVAVDHRAVLAAPAARGSRRSAAPRRAARRAGRAPAPGRPGSSGAGPCGRSSARGSRSPRPARRSRGRRRTAARGSRACGASSRRAARAARRRGRAGGRGRAAPPAVTSGPARLPRPASSAPATQRDSKARSKRSSRRPDGRSVRRRRRTATATRTMLPRPGRPGRSLQTVIVCAKCRSLGG